MAIAFVAFVDELTPTSAEQIHFRRRVKVCLTEIEARVANAMKLRCQSRDSFGESLVAALFLWVGTHVSSSAVDRICKFSLTLR